MDHIFPRDDKLFDCAKYHLYWAKEETKVHIYEHLFKFNAVKYQQKISDLDQGPHSIK
jgi:hypothetical protein